MAVSRVVDRTAGRKPQETRKRVRIVKPKRNEKGTLRVNYAGPWGQVKYYWARIGRKIVRTPNSNEMREHAKAAGYRGIFISQKYEKGKSKPMPPQGDWDKFMVAPKGEGVDNG